jgi:hypothetical protein
LYTARNNQRSQQKTIYSLEAQSGECLLVVLQGRLNPNRVLTEETNNTVTNLLRTEPAELNIYMIMIFEYKTLKTRSNKQSEILTACSAA